MPYYFLSQIDDVSAMVLIDLVAIWPFYAPMVKVYLGELIPDLICGSMLNVELSDEGDYNKLYNHSASNQLFMLYLLRIS